MVIRKSLYGHPAAGRRWAETRDQFILTHFNETHDSWMYTCRRMLGEPCMFYIQRHHIHDVSKCHTTIMLIHTDDADMIGESEEMFDFICNAEFMLCSQFAMARAMARLQRSIKPSTSPSNASCIWSQFWRSLPREVLSPRISSLQRLRKQRRRA